MHTKTLKRLLSAALALVLCLTATGCGGDVSPTQTPESTPEQEANTLVLGVCRQSASALSFRGVVEDYNDTNPAKTVELVYFDHPNQMLDAIDEGTQVDMYLLDEPFGVISSPIGEYWDASLDLTDYLDTELAPNLAEALSHDGELRYLPFDFSVRALHWSLDGEPASFTQATQLAANAGTTLFAPWRSRDAIVEYQLYSYLCSADEAVRSEVLGVVHTLEPDTSNTSNGSAYLDIWLNGHPGFGLSGYDGSDYSVGIPGATTLGIYEPKMVFGIFSACDDPDTAWDFLSTLYSADNQMQTGWLPATAAALEARLIQTAKYSNEEEADIAREIINGTTLAVSLNTQNVEQDWFMDYFSSPERVAVLAEQQNAGKEIFY